MLQCSFFHIADCHNSHGNLQYSHVFFLHYGCPTKIPNPPLDPSGGRQRRSKKIRGSVGQWVGPKMSTYIIYIPNARNHRPSCKTPHERGVSGAGAGWPGADPDLAAHPSLFFAKRTRWVGTNGTTEHPRKRQIGETNVSVTHRNKGCKRRQMGLQDSLPGSRKIKGKSMVPGLAGLSKKSKTSPAIGNPRKNQ